jgi:hypothetical protein
VDLAINDKKENNNGYSNKYKPTRDQSR